MTTGLEHPPGQRRGRRLSFRPGNRDDAAAQPAGRELELACHRNARGTGRFDGRKPGRHAGAQDDEIRSRERRLLVATQLQRHARGTEPILVVDPIAQVRQRHERAAPHQQLRGSDTATCRADHDDALAAHGERVVTHLSFNVVRLNSAKMIARIRKRVMTFGSLQPMSSK